MIIFLGSSGSGGGHPLAAVSARRGSAAAGGCAVGADRHKATPGVSCAAGSHAVGPKAD